jgi:hypothetical protein
MSTVNVSHFWKAHPAPAPLPNFNDDTEPTVFGHF